MNRVCLTYYVNANVLDCKQGNTNGKAMIPTASTLKIATTAQEEEKKRIYARKRCFSIAISNYEPTRYLKRKARLNADPVEKERVRIVGAALKRQLRAGNKKSAEAREKQRIYNLESYWRSKANLDADPVEKERVRIAKRKRVRERNLADPELQAKRVISNRNSKKAWDARLKANPVEWERAKKAEAERSRKRRARTKKLKIKR